MSHLILRVLIRRGNVTNLGFFGEFEKYFKISKPTTFLRLPWAITGRNMKNFDFSSCATTGAKLVEIPS